MADHKNRLEDWTFPVIPLLGFFLVTFGFTAFVRLYFEAGSGGWYPEGGGVGVIVGYLVLRLIHTEGVSQRQWTRHKTAILSFLVTVFAVLAVALQYGILIEITDFARGSGYPGGLFYVFLPGFVVYEIIMSTRETSQPSKHAG
jgi:uncharacterized membrane protein